MSVIQVDDLWVKHRMAKDYALKGLTLKVRQGEIVGIIGSTGAGKSTLCACIAGLVPNLVKCDEFKGDVVVDGLNTRDHPVGEICRKVGIVFQDYESQLFRTNVLLETAFGPENLGLPVDEIRRRVGDALKWTRLEGLDRRYTFNLSGGQKQRLAIAAVLSMLPKILVLDEATSDLDPIGKFEIYEIIRKLKRKREAATLLMVDHHLDKVAEIAERVIVLEDGKIMYDGAPREVFSHVDELLEMKLAPPQVTEAFHKLGYKQRYPLNTREAEGSFPKNWKIKKMEYEREEGGGEKAVEVEDLWHAYEPEQWVLQNINLRINEGEFIGLIGQNGSGKTTLANLIAGIMTPTKGKIRLFGEDVTKQTILRRGRVVGYVFQNPDYQLFSDTVKDELAFGPNQLRSPPKETEQRVANALKLLGMEEIADEDPFFLSKANRQRVAVGSVLTLEPRIMILDEPTTGLSPGETRQIMELAQRLNMEGKTVIAITHDMWVVAEYCRRTIVLHEGEIKLDGPTRQVFSQVELLSQYFLSPPQITQFTLQMFGEPCLNVGEFVSLVERTGFT